MFWHSIGESWHAIWVVAKASSDQVTALPLRVKSSAKTSGASSTEDEVLFALFIFSLCFMWAHSYLVREAVCSEAPEGTAALSSSQSQAFSWLCFCPLHLDSIFKISCKENAKMLKIMGLLHIILSQSLLLKINPMFAKKVLLGNKAWKTDNFGGYCIFPFFLSFFAQIATDLSQDILLWAHLRCLLQGFLRVSHTWMLASHQTQQSLLKGT